MSFQTLILALKLHMISYPVGSLFHHDLSIWNIKKLFQTVHRDTWVLKFFFDTTRQMEVLVWIACSAYVTYGSWHTICCLPWSLTILKSFFYLILDHKIQLLINISYKVFEYMHQKFIMFKSSVSSRLLIG